MRLLAALYVVAQALDLLTTRVALAGGRFTEGNPLFGPMSPASITGSAAKGLLALGVQLGVLAVSERHREGTLRAMTVLATVGPALNALRLA